MGLEIDDHHFSSRDTDIASALDLDSESDKEEAYATDIFFNCPVEKSPTNCDVPLTEEEIGCIDVRQGCEDVSKQWPQLGRESGHVTSGHRKGVLLASNDDALSIPESTLSVATMKPCFRDYHTPYGLAGLISLLQEAATAVGGGDVGDDEDPSWHPHTSKFPFWHRAASGTKSPQRTSAVVSAPALSSRFRTMMMKVSHGLI